MDCCPPSFTPTQFYGKSRKNKRGQKALAKKLGQNAVRLPTAFSHRILGPTNCWRVFFRQTDAFGWAKKTAEDVMVFAFENTDRDPALATGQRRYLVTSLDVFWHYYSQMEPSKRHHYEIIPEGWPCRLYFDLEFLKTFNPGSDGERVVGVLIQYVCMWLEAVFNVRCDRSCVLDLDASTESKFSRHLIFHIPGAVFANCVAAGNFVRHIFGLLVKYIKLKSNEQYTSPAMLCEHCCRQTHQGFSNCMKSQPSIVNNCDFSEMSDEEFMVAAQICDNVISEGCRVRIARSNSSETNHIINCISVACKANDTSSDAVKSRSNDNSKSAPIEVRINDFSSMDLNNGTTDFSSQNLQSAIRNNINVEKKQSQNHTAISDNATDCPSSSGEIGELCANCLTDPDSSDNDMQSSTNEMIRICGQFSLNDLQSLLVTTSDGNKTTFSDLGVYTKNRNFRLYLSSKLNKKNPLSVAAHNQFTPDRTGKISPEQAIFNASLVSNIRYSSDVRILTFGSQEQNKCTTENPRSVNCGSAHKEDCLEGRNCLSPYPEIDGFIESLTWSHGCRGRVRHWRCFRSSDSLLYDISGCRWCGNVQREHRSNNIMYIVDLRRGVCYQKCYDPDCQAVGYRSEAVEIPSNLLPSSYFEADWEDDDDDWKDDMGSNLNDDTKDNSDSSKTSLGEHHQGEKWRQNDGHKNSLIDPDELRKDQVSTTSFDDDDDDDLLLAAAEELELGLSQLTQIPDLAAAPWREVDDVDWDDVAMVAAAEEVEIYFHPDLYPNI